ncbi:ABC transporter permease [Deinococcus aquiradiocola]|uniref:Spermidine/putrescine ABC transporter permease n=1 Tax=Deinococcus aquiradiocola TaxID=393059 RepID=A0A917PCQ5_9DEIO|nr:ABC transporter permease subunit [Deinococcus aquiradiocola]GGJ71078.1 spermidine/putrescine ABC transporter permease [Deinococcus aquiradiocola]
MRASPAAQGGRWLVILLGFLYFFLPILALAIFSLWAGGTRYDFSAYAHILQDPQFRQTFGLSFMLALETIVISLVLVVPAAFWVNLRAPGLRNVLGLLSVLSFVVPPIVLVGGLSALYRGPEWFVGTPQFLVAGYVVLALPYTYRTLDTGLRALDLQTLSEAAQSLGAGWGTLLWRVILPNISAAVLGAALLTFAIVLGEFTFANVLLFNTFAVYINYIGQTQSTPAAALSLISLAVTWLAMLVMLRVGRGRVALGGTR